MTERLTKKEKGFVKDYIATGNGTQAALNNYDTESVNTAAMIASTNIRKPKIVKAIQDALPDDLLATKHLALLNKVDKEGEIDVQAVSKGLEMAYKVKGSYAPEKHDVRQLVVELSKEIAEKNEINTIPSNNSEGQA